MSFRTDRTMILWSLALLTIPFAGCGGDAPAMSSSTEEGSVSGVIKFEGKPVTRGQVHFDPSSNVRKGAQARTATIAKDGTYSVSTLVGQNRVRFSGVTSKRDLSFEELGRDIKSGTQTLDFDLAPTQPRRGR